MNWLRKLGRKVEARKPDTDKARILPRDQVSQSAAEGVSLKIPKRKLVDSTKSSDRGIFFSPIETNTDKILSKARQISEVGSNLTKQDV